VSEIEDAHRQEFLPCNDFQTGTHLPQGVGTTFWMCVE